MDGDNAHSEAPCLDVYQPKLETSTIQTTSVKYPGMEISNTVGDLIEDKLSEDPGLLQYEADKTTGTLKLKVSPVSAGGSINYTATH